MWHVLNLRHSAGVRRRLAKVPESMMWADISRGHHAPGRALQPKRPSKKGYKRVLLCRTSKAGRNLRELNRPRLVRSRSIILGACRQGKRFLLRSSRKADRVQSSARKPKRSYIRIKRGLSVPSTLPISLYKPAASTPRLSAYRINSNFKSGGLQTFVQRSLAYRLTWPMRRSKSV
jgi:hypothetical protein